MPFGTLALHYWGGTHGPPFAATIWSTLTKSLGPGAGMCSLLLSLGTTRVNLRALQLQRHLVAGVQAVSGWPGDRPCWCCCVHVLPGRQCKQQPRCHHV